MIKTFTNRVSVALFFACIVTSGQSPACDDLIVRDAAFDEPRDIYQLCVIAQSNDVAAQTTARRLKYWFETSAAGLNITVQLLAADAADVIWSDYGIPSAPPHLPVVVLVGRRTNERKSFVVDHWEPAPTDADLEVLRSSAAREAIRNAVVKDLAAIVYSPGTNNDESSAERVIEQSRNAMSDAGLPGVSVVRVERTDPRERLLLAFANVPREGPDWVGVVFGKGKFMAPLEGDEITEARVVDMLEALSADCTCSQSPSRMGVDVPMLWDTSDDDAVVKLVASDPNADDFVSIGTLHESEQPGSPETLSLLAPTLWTIGGGVLVLIVASVGIVWRHRTI